MRTCGVLMHITSLPSPYGVGTLGSEAYKFVDFLKKAGQTYWQILPVGPTGFGDSPYQSYSAFAGNPMLIDIDELIKAGLVSEDDKDLKILAEKKEFADFGQMFSFKRLILAMLPLRQMPTASRCIFSANSAERMPGGWTIMRCSCQ